MFDDVLFHLLVCPTGNIFFDAVLLVVFLDEVVGAVTRFARFAVHQGVGKTADMTACLPRCRVHNYCAVKSDVVGIFNHEFLPPSLLDVVFELNAERAVVPRVGKTAVDFTSGIDESAVFCEGNKFVHSQLCHKVISFRTHPDDEPINIVYK